MSRTKNSISIQDVFGEIIPSSNNQNNLPIINEFSSEYYFYLDGLNCILFRNKHVSLIECVILALNISYINILEPTEDLLLIKSFKRDKLVEKLLEHLNIDLLTEITDECINGIVNIIGFNIYILHGHQIKLYNCGNSDAKNLILIRENFIYNLVCSDNLLLFNNDSGVIKKFNMKEDIIICDDIIECTDVVANEQVCMNDSDVCIDDANQIKSIYKYKLSELQEIAISKNIDICKIVNDKKKNKTKKELYDAICQ